jgi:distribution and morphology protein 10
MMGHISGAYTAQVSRDLSLSSRFDFNIYSYDSEWTMGAEWWLRPSRAKPGSDGAGNDASAFPPSAPSWSSVEAPTLPYGVTGVVKARASTSNVGPFFPCARDRSGKALNSPLNPIQDIALLWEGRLKNVLVGLGVASNLSSGAKPIKSFGLELSYFSSE